MNKRKTHNGKDRSDSLKKPRTDGEIERNFVTLMAMGMTREKREEIEKLSEVEILAKQRRYIEFNKSRSNSAPSRNGPGI